MNPDPLIDEIRAVRRKISAEFGHDPRRLVAHYMEMDRRARTDGKRRFVEAPAPSPEVVALHDKAKAN